MQAASEQAVAKIEPLSEAVANRRVEHERNAILPPPDGCDLIEQTRAKPDSDHKELYTELLTRQGDLTRRMHAADYL